MSRPRAWGTDFERIRRSTGSARDDFDPVSPSDPTFREQIRSRFQTTSGDIHAPQLLAATTEHLRHFVRLSDDVQENGRTPFYLIR